ncbi:MAG: aldo/keto reductase [Ramlibacter sp.]|nr:aldo/keto reductase [Ramlibacter sp.]
MGGGSSFGRAGDAGAQLLNTCWDAGLRHFDTAPLYGRGESERRYGQTLRDRPRNEFVLSTKVGRNAPDSYDYSESGVRRSLEGSLDRLRLGRIDLVSIHDLDRDKHGDQFDARYEQALTGAYPALQALRSSGAIGAVGVGLSSPDVALRIARNCELDYIMLAGAYTLLEHAALDELLPWCQENKVSVLLAAPFNTGILATGAVDGARYYYRPAPQSIIDRTRRLEAVCGRHGVPLAAAALQFPLLHPAVTSVVVGHEKPDEAMRNLALLRHPVPSTLWVEMKEEGLIPELASTAGG